ncbi:protein RDM16 isoform X1 [Neltuma alba]|uniref:protein RDM16 isoform X1 n=3 Tax=Neltuma alba TaxID=207710 RepID=UPI0010A37BBD|nr:protein RDM16-like isoform X1 [Prosopis alba]XP_028799487.1 protein RDM16-like isoform X1 [Prosopis alba]XP_028799488.1 protein RDM16-like isoform X1 [Prosopis alba]
MTMIGAIVIPIAITIIGPTGIPSANTRTNPGVKDHPSCRMIRGMSEKGAGMGFTIEMGSVSGLASLGVREREAERGRSIGRRSVRNHTRRGIQTMSLVVSGKSRWREGTHRIRTRGKRGNTMKIRIRMIGRKRELGFLERKERRRFEDKFEEGKELNGGAREGRRERRRFGDKVKREEDLEDNEDGKQVKVKYGDKVKKEENLEDNENGKQVKVNEMRVKEEPDDQKFDNAQGSAHGNALVGNGFALGSHISTSRSVPEASMVSSPSPSIKVSMISTTNENKGVSITGSHEVTGKSSTDGSSSTTGKSGNISLDALAKAKKALQMQKELSEKLKKIPQLNKSSTKMEGSTQLGLQDESKMPSVSAGVAAMTATTASAGSVANISNFPAAAAAAQPPTATSAAPAGIGTLPNYEAVRRAQELAARMGFRQDPQFAPLINMFPGQTVTDITVPQKPTKAPVLRLDAQGREIDEHGNVVNVIKPSNLSTLKVNINKQKKDLFQIFKPVLDVDPESNPHFDERMGINKTKLLRPKRMSFQFVEEGKWSKEAETIKLKSKFGEAQAKEHKAKQAQLAKAKAAPDINPNLIEITERVVIKEKPKEQIPEIEWWDAHLLRYGTYDDIADGTIIKMEKITIYVEHPRPIEPPAEPAPPPPQPLKLTKKEQKKLRTQRRLAKEKERQEMIRQGVIEPPKPKVKISNLMKVLGSEATQDPTRLEKEIRSAAAEREQAHIDRNVARKLTPAERREKKEKKLFDDPNTVETLVSVYKINDLSHPKARFRVDVNAQENRLTGCAVISDGISVVVVEGGSKSIKRYGKLMLRRINWSEFSKEEEEHEESDDEKPVNKCVLVWQGSVAKPSFNRFFVHECMTEAAARKIFADAGVGHYWDLSVNYVEQ